MHRRFLLITGLVAALVAGGSFFYFQKAPCEEPVSYRIGSIDPRFGVTLEEFKADIDRALTIWEKPSGLDLFAYDPQGTLEVNLVYDRRQEITQKEQVLNQNISQTSKVADSVKREYEQLRAAYERAQAAYTEALTEFTQAQAAYNRKVEYWNSKGGAPKPQYDALNAEKDSLFAAQAALEVERQEVNRLAEAVNAYIQKYNLLIAAINTDINAINNDGLAGTQFEAGVYISDADGARINVFQFENKVDFVRLLAHEFGHALLLDHNENPDSIMNPVNQSETLVLSAEDFAALQARCGLSEGK